MVLYWKFLKTIFFYTFNISARFSSNKSILIKNLPKKSLWKMLNVKKNGMFQRGVKGKLIYFLQLKINFYSLLLSAGSWTGGQTVDVCSFSFIFFGETNTGINDGNSRRAVLCGLISDLLIHRSHLQEELVCVILVLLQFPLYKEL